MITDNQDDVERYWEGVITGQGEARQLVKPKTAPRWRFWVVAPALYLLRRTLVLCSWGVDRLRLWREGQRIVIRHPPYACEVALLPGGVIRDYSRPLHPSEGWNEHEGDPLAGVADDVAPRNEINPSLVDS